MKLVVHKMHGCKLCRRCEKLLSQWGIPFRPVYDEPKRENQRYPYIEIEIEYTELVEWVGRGVL